TGFPPPGTGTVVTLPAPSSALVSGAPNNNELSTAKAGPARIIVMRQLIVTSSQRPTASRRRRRPATNTPTATAGNSNAKLLGSGTENVPTKFPVIDSV